MASFAHFLSLLFVLACAVEVVLATGAFEQYTEIGVAGVGYNRGPSGIPIWEFPNLAFLTQPPFNLPPFVVVAGFNTTGVFDSALGEGGGNSQPVTPATPATAVLATHFDETGMPMMGMSRSNVPDSVLNIPMDDNRVLIDDFGVIRDKIPCLSDTSAHNVITRSAPCSEPITLGRWNEASGVLRVRCYADGTNKLVLVMQDLMPNRVYTAWYVTENVPKVIQGFPLGGVPNSFTTNGDGYYLMQREMGFCPFAESHALSFAVHMRSDGQNYGGVPVPFLNQEDNSTAFDGFIGAFPGAAIHIQLNFNINGEVIGPASDLDPNDPKLADAMRIVDSQQAWMF